MRNINICKNCKACGKSSVFLSTYANFKQKSEYLDNENLRQKKLVEEFGDAYKCQYSLGRYPNTSNEDDGKFISEENYIKRETRKDCLMQFEYFILEQNEKL